MIKTFVISFDWDIDDPYSYSTGLFIHETIQPKKPFNTRIHCFVEKDILNSIKLKAAEWFQRKNPTTQSYLNIDWHDDANPLLEYSAPGAGPFQSSYKVVKSNDLLQFLFDAEYCKSRSGKDCVPKPILGNEFTIPISFKVT